jgi:uncharacterized protein YjbI with pentapeptide repeats
VIVPLKGADLRGADLSGADLSSANLRDADLSDAIGFTEEQLEGEARTLKGATMPNGQKYEDWRDDSGDRTEDGENSGPS